MKPTVLYYQDGAAPITLYIIADRGNGTVDLGREDGSLVVGGCRLAEEPSPGACVMSAEARKALEAEAKAKAKAEAEAAKKAADEAKAAEAAKAAETAKK